MPLVKDKREEWENKLENKKNLSACEKCGLSARGCTPIMGNFVSADSPKAIKITIVLDKPSAVHDKYNSYLSGKTVKFLLDELKLYGNFNIFVTGLTKCSTELTVKAVQKKLCTNEYLWGQLSGFKPDLVFAVGADSAKYLSKIVITKSRGRVYDLQSPVNGKEIYKVAPVFNPSVVSIEPAKIINLKLDIKRALEIFSYKKFKKKYIFITDSNIDKFFEYYNKYILYNEICSVDIETYTLNMFSEESYIYMIGFSGKPHTAVSMMWETVKNNPRLYSIIKEIIESTEIKKVGHGIKFDGKYLLYKENIDLKGLGCDTHVAHYLMDESHTARDLDTLAYRYTQEGGFKKTTEKDMHDVTKIKLKDLLIRNLKDCDITLQLRDIFIPILRKEGTYKLLPFYNKLNYVFTHIECDGAKIDLPYCKESQVTFSKKLIEIEKEFEEIWKFHGFKEFNLSSPKQLANLFFNKLGWKVLKKTAKGSPSTDAKVLEKYAKRHEEAKLLLEHRQYSKLLNTYIVPFLERIDKDELIHCTFNLAFTSTGRLSSKEPNLQNIPRKKDAPGPYDNIKRCFISRFAGGKILEADLSQIELRVIAMVSKEPHFINAYLNDRDIHAETARLIYPGKEITEELRSAAKQVNFSIVYGAGPKLLAENLGCDEFTAKRILNSFMSKLYLFKEWKSGVTRQIETDHRIVNLLGRIRRLPNAGSELEQLRVKAVLEGVNFPIQSLASDLMLISLIDVFDHFLKNKLKSKIILTVHDSVVVDTYPDETSIVVKILKHCMEKKRFKFINVPLKVDIKIGDNWLDLKKYEEVA